MGFVIAVLITAASVDDGVAAIALFKQIDPVKYPRLKIIWGDGKYHNLALRAWLAEHRPGWTLEVKHPPEGSKGFVVVSKRWVVERTFAWMGSNLSLQKDSARQRIHHQNRPLGRCQRKTGSRLRQNVRLPGRNKLDRSGRIRRGTTHPPRKRKLLRTGH